MSIKDSYNFKRSWCTLTSLVSRDFKLKYRRSVLGVLWSVLNPLLMMCVLTAVFSSFFKFNIENFPLYLILGNTIFALMADSTTGAMDSILGSASLIKKIKIEKIIFPLEKIVFNVVNFVLSLIAVLAVMLYFHILPTINVIFLPLLVFYVAVFSAGLGLLLSSLAVFFRDVCHLWGVVITAWTYLTPLFYPVDILPDWMLVVEKFNPMYYYVEYFREIFLYGITPSIQMNCYCFVFAVISLVVGLLVFKKTEDKFILYV